MDTHQHVLLVADIANHQRKMVFLIVVISVQAKLKLAFICWQADAIELFNLDVIHKILFQV